MKFLNTALAGLMAVTGVTIFTPTEADARDGYRHSDGDRRYRYTSSRYSRAYRPVRSYRPYRYSYYRPHRYYRPSRTVVYYSQPSYYNDYYYNPGYYSPGYYSSYYGPSYYGGTGISIGFGGGRSWYPHGHSYRSYRHHHHR